jgi:predicted dehydrogenase
MKVAIIGFGHAGRMHLAGMRMAAGIEPVAVCDPAADRRLAATEIGLRAYSRLEDLLHEEEIDAVVVCTPPGAHAAAAHACLRRGIHVLCEKPMAVDSSEALSLFEAADRAVVTVASKFRHVPEIRHVRHLSAAGELGEPIGFSISFRAVIDMSTRWHVQSEHSGGGVIADNGPHAFDIITYLFGEIGAVQATVLPARQQLPVEDEAWLEVETAGGVVGTVDLSWSQAPADDVYMTLQFTRALVVIGWKSSMMKRCGRGWSNFGGRYDRDKAHCDMHNAFRAALRDGRDLWITPRECVRSVAAVEAGYRSLRSGRRERVAPVRTRFAESERRQDAAP